MKTTLQPDATTREFTRLWGAREIPTAQVTGGNITPGNYRAMATLGWMEKRGPFAVVGVHLIILRNLEYVTIGAVTVGLPVTTRNELFVNSFLVRLGWDGRVWPYDDDKGWPDGTDDEPQIRQLMQQAGGMAATLCFAPNKDQGGGVPIIPIPILKRHGPFPWAPFEGGDMPSPPAATFQRFKALCNDPSPFVR
jgi:hypothetical protein